MAKISAIFVLIIFGYMALIEAKNIRNGGERIKKFFTINGSEYYIDTDGWMTYADAKRDCESRGSRLITFSSQQKYDEILNWLKDNQLSWQWFWTGGYRNFNSDQWVWGHNNERIGNLIWAANRPEAQVLSESRCITFSPDFNGWDDDGCSIFLPHICEKCQ
ncbi:lymphocyte antigen 75-like [Neocloeon triangulifer]|uniref:lymphocyte antigen 75-like n=1 Tax=Neocloeon triangulifer TaxID=2078957 RepID=UPI00286F5463|nr:lymphocyte antigen 75-like [Neocloeon triangulifer]